jgi:hypothetical protein
MKQRKHKGSIQCRQFSRCILSRDFSRKNLDLRRRRCIIGGSTLKVLFASFDDYLGLLWSDYALLIHEGCKMRILLLRTGMMFAGEALMPLTVFIKIETGISPVWFGRFCFANPARAVWNNLWYGHTATVSFDTL